jgi:2'-5' RNA ligase
MGRLFFAIWPEPAAGRQLARVGESLAELAGGNPVPVEKIHMTLAFLGSLDEGRDGAAVLAAAPVRSARNPDDGRQRGILPPRQGRVGGAIAAVEGLARLQSQLAERLRERGFALEDRAFTPHITLVRKLARPVPRAPMPAIEWKSRAFTLVETTGDGRYEIRESWGLRAV